MGGEVSTRFARKGGREKGRITRRDVSAKRSAGEEREEPGRADRKRTGAIRRRKVIDTDRSWRKRERERENAGRWS